MRRIVVLFCFILVTGGSQAQVSDQMRPRERFAQSITAGDLRAHLTFFADDLLEGRETATRGQLLAARYLAAAMDLNGLAPGAEDGSFYQVYHFHYMDLRSASLKLGKKTYQYGLDFFTFRPAIRPELESPVVYAGFGITEDGYDNLAGLDVSGKWVLMLGGDRQEEDSENSYGSLGKWSRRAQNLLDQGAAGVLIGTPKDQFERWQGYAKNPVSRMGKGPVPETTPVFFISEKLTRDILSTGKLNWKSERKRLVNDPSVSPLNPRKSKLVLEAEATLKPVPVQNVLGVMSGAERADEWVVITAHYDHLGSEGEEVYNGADDDGSGTVAILEIAQAFSEAVKAGYRPRRSILFMAVSGEEKGLLGSRYYTDHPVYPLENTMANLNIDMIGRVGSNYVGSPDSANYVYLIGSDKISTELDSICRAVNRQSYNLVLDYRFNAEDDPNRFYYRSDHYNFAKKGVPVAFFFNGTHEDYHRPTDTIEKINYAKMEKISRLIFGIAWELANKPDRLRIDHPVIEGAGR